MLTPQEAETLFETLRQMTADGRTVIFISHKLNEVTAVSDRVTVLRGGRSIATVATADATARSLAALMVGRELVDGAREARPPRRAAARARGRLGRGHRGTEAVRGVSLSVRARRDRRGRGRLRQRAARARRGDRGPARAGSRGRSRSTVRRSRAATRGRRSGRRHRLRARGPDDDRRRAGAEHRLEPRAPVVPRASRSDAGPCCCSTGSASGPSSLIERYSISAPGPSAQVRVLSGGNLQKVVIAREFSGDPARRRRRLADPGPRRRRNRDGPRLPLRRRRQGRGRARLQRGPRRDPRHRRPDRGDLRGAIAGEMPASEASIDEIGLLMAGAHR